MKLISQKEARAAGLTRFFTGRACVRGHVAPRQTSNFRCVECGFIKSRQWEKQHPEIKNAASKRQYAALKQDVITKLGGKCACCGEKTLIFLCVDHINGGGGKHRAAVGSYVIIRWLRRQINSGELLNIKKDFRVLCWNCNSAMHFLGYCPHYKPRGT